MPMTPLELPADPHDAAARVRDLSAVHPVLVFKKSPICPISHRAEANFRAWLRAFPSDRNAHVAEIDVIAQRALARGLTAEFEVRHESPQALWFSDGHLAWHGSHDALTVVQFDALLAEAGHG